MLPDPYENEETAEVAAEVWLLRDEYLRNAKAWKDLADQITDQIKQSIGSATAVTVHGVKVATYRPTRRYAEGALLKAYPDLTQHFFRNDLTSVFEVDRFAKAHPEIASAYVVRSFREVGE